jgi:long-subunit fatty acid transport protein
MRLRFSSVALLTSALLLRVAPAQAGGLEYAGQGAQALGRGGAVTAKADDPMVLAHNPAGLAELRGSQFLLNLNLALFDACVDPAGYYGWGIYGGGKGFTELPDPETHERTRIPLGAVDPATLEPVAADYYNDPYDTVCLDQNITPIPQIAWTRRISEKLGMGFGFIFPAVQPSGAWGGRNGVIKNEDGELRPAATRYMGLSGNTLAMFPNLGVGYRIVDALRVGASFEWGVFGVNQFTMASAFGGTALTNDIVAHVKAQDWFVPALTASVHAVPMDNLDIVAAFRWQDDLKAKGDIDLTTGIFDAQFKSNTSGHIPITSLVNKFPWKLRAGIRYADRFAPRPKGTGRDEADPASVEVIHDPLQDERWDIELDVQYELNSRNDKQVLTYYECDLPPTDPNAATQCPPRATILFVPESGAMPMPIEFPHPSGPQDTQIEKHWKDQVSLRLGGTYNVLPGKLGISAGTHYETRGVDPSYMQIDFWPVSRFGLSGGVTVRVFKSIDLVLSYAHIFQETIVVAPPEHQNRSEIYACYSPPPADPNVPPPMQTCHAPAGKVVTIDKSAGPPIGKTDANGQPFTEQPTVKQAKSQGTPDGTARLTQNLNRVVNGEPPWIVNAGRYRSHFDIIAAGVNVHF